MGEELTRAGFQGYLTVCTVDRELEVVPDDPAQAQGREPGWIGSDRRIDGDPLLEVEQERGPSAQLDSPCLIRVNPKIRGMERDDRTTDLNLSRPRQCQMHPSIELCLPDREVVIMPSIQHGRNPRLIPGKDDDRLGCDADQDDDLKRFDLRLAIRA
jgi:hypothetical protein